MDLVLKLPPALNLGVFKICGSVICGLVENGVKESKVKYIFLGVWLTGRSGGLLNRVNK